MGWSLKKSGEFIATVNDIVSKHSNEKGTSDGKKNSLKCTN